MAAGCLVFLAYMRARHWEGGRLECRTTLYHGARKQSHPVMDQLHETVTGRLFPFETNVQPIVRVVHR